MKTVTAVVVVVLVFAGSRVHASAAPSASEACRELPAKQVGANLHARGEAFTTGGAPRFGTPTATLHVSTCEYCPRNCTSWPHARLVIAELASQAAAEEELAWSLARAKSSGHALRDVDGPWQRGVEIGDLEVYALIEKRIVHFQLVQTYPTKRRFDKGAARRHAASVSRQQPRATPGLAATIPAVSARACPYASAREVAHAIGLERLQSSLSIPIISPGAATDEVAFHMCNFNVGPAISLPAAWFSAEVLEDKRAARREYASILEHVRDDGVEPRRIKGPWKRAHDVGGDQAYALIGSKILQFQVIESAPASQHYRVGAPAKVLRHASSRSRHPSLISASELLRDGTPWPAALEAGPR